MIETKEAVIGFRVSEKEKLFLDSISKKKDINIADIIRFAIIKTWEKPNKITREEIKKCLSNVIFR